MAVAAIDTFFYFPDADTRKCGEQNGLETRVVHTLNYGFSTLAYSAWVIANASNTPPEHYDGNIEIQRN